MTKSEFLTERRKLWEMNPIWEVLTFEEKEFVDRNVEVCVYKKNEVLHHEGDTPTHMMMLADGKLRVYKEGVSQKQQIIRMLKPFDVFAYRAIIADEGYNTCVSAFEQSVVYRLRRDIFMKLIQENQRFCFLILTEMAKDLGRSDRQVVNLTQKHIRGRLADALLTLKQNYGLDEDEATISIYMSREDLANLSNMTTANAIRTLSQFASEGLISIDGRKIKLLDEPMLARLSKQG